MKRRWLYEVSFVPSALLTAFREWIKVQRLLSAAAPVMTLRMYQYALPLPRPSKALPNLSMLPNPVCTLAGMG